jgi:adenylate cyclase
MPTPVDISDTVLVTSLEHSIWRGLNADLESSLNRLNLAHLSSPGMLILHDLIDCAVRAMHRNVFLQLAETDFGMVVEGNEDNLEGLYKAEVAEHGSQNIARYCRENGWHVAVSFPQATDTIVALSIPVKWDINKLKTSKLIVALGKQLHQSALAGSAEGCVVTLKTHAGKVAPLQLGGLLDEADSLNSVQRIHQKLGYGVIQFSSAGEVIAVSRSMLTSVKLAVNAESMTSLCAAIPFNFYNDIVWGLALAGESGVFENYRIRMRLPGEEGVSVLFNVSGYRDEQSIIHSLWQIVSLADGAVSLAEGSMLSEVRINKITRNYVPQLVEQKAREAVRLGKSKLTNEECFVAVLFCDIVGFTSYVESNASSESIINTLNSILRRVSSSVKRYNGSIDKFMGDSVMAIFRNPADAILAALDMQSHSADINSLRSRAGQETLCLRIGIHWGEVVIGNVGTAERLDWTAIGDVVNTASRIEKNCKPGSILISQTLRDALAPLQYAKFRFGDIFHLTVKGKREALSVCHIKHPDEKPPV